MKARAAGRVGVGGGGAWFKCSHVILFQQQEGGGLGGVGREETKTLLFPSLVFLKRRRAVLALLFLIIQPRRLDMRNFARSLSSKKNFFSSPAPARPGPDRVPAEDRSRLSIVFILETPLSQASETIRQEVRNDDQQINEGAALRSREVEDLKALRKCVFVCWCGTAFVSSVETII